MTFQNPTNTLNSGWQSLPLPLKMPSLPLLKYLRRASEDSPILKINGRSAGLVYGYRARSQESARWNGSVLF